MDRNNYYGGESASLNLETLYKTFKPEDKIPADLGRSRDYNIDLCPKFLMACGDLVKVLLHTKVTKYLEFKSIAGSYVFKDGDIHKVPCTPKEALNSKLMGMFQKRRFRTFLQYVNAFNPDDTKTHDGLNLNAVKCQDLFAHFKLDENTISFTGHAMALYIDDTYLQRPARELVEKVKLYAYSVSRYGNSPYIYPMWGLGGLPEGFSRLAAIHGGTYMLSKPIEEILYDSNGVVTGVKSEGKVARCRRLIGDPTYFLGTNKIRKVGQVARCICILSHPVPNTNSDSCQIIIPAKTQNRHSDIYISTVSFHHQVAAKGKFISVLSCPVESKNPKAELAPAFALLGAIDQQFFWVSDRYEPVSDGKTDQVYITSSYDATTHFEGATREVLEVFQRIMGKPIDLTITPDADEPTADEGALEGKATETAVANG